MDDRYDKMMDRMERVTLAGFTAANEKGFTNKNTQAKPISQEENNTPEKRREVAYYIPSIYGNATSFNLDTLRAMITAGNVKSDTIIRVDGQDWPACTMKELSDLFIK